MSIPLKPLNTSAIRDHGRCPRFQPQRGNADNQRFLSETAPRRLASGSRPQTQASPPADRNRPGFQARCRDPNVQKTHPSCLVVSILYRTRPFPFLFLVLSEHL